MPGLDGVPNDADMVAIAQSRDRVAFRRVFDHFGPRIKGYLRKLGAEEAAAEDILQDVMLAIWNRAGQFDPSRAALSTWIYTIARNRRIDMLRRDQRGDVDWSDPTLEAPPAPRGDVLAEAEEFKLRVKAAVELLPSEQAQLLRIFYFEDRSHSAISAELGLPLGTVKSRLRLALAKLRVMLEGLA